VQTTLTCPTTDLDVEFDLPSDDASIIRMWHAAVKVHCPECNEFHEQGYRDFFVSGVMGQFRCLPADVKEARVH